MSSSSTFVPGGQQIVNITEQAKKLPAAPVLLLETKQESVIVTPNKSCTFSIDCSEKTSTLTRLYQIFRFIFTGKLTV